MAQTQRVMRVSHEPIVAAQLLRKAGFNIDLQTMDWQTLVSRRTSKKPPREGGWKRAETSFESHKPEPKVDQEAPPVRSGSRRFAAMAAMLLLAVIAGATC